MLLRAAVLIAVVAGVGACRDESARVEPPAPEIPAAEIPAPEEKQGALLDQVSAVAVFGDRTWVGTEAGLVVLSPVTGSFTLHAGDSETSLEGVTDVAVAADGTAWTTHRATGGHEQHEDTPDAHVRPLRGGVRALGTDGTLRAWGAGDGLGEGDVVAVALVGPRVAVAASAGLVQWSPPAEGKGRFEPLLPGDSRRVEHLDPETGAHRTVTEFRPRDERVMALAADGDALVVGTTHGLHRVEGDSLTRVTVPCRVAERTPASVLALASGEGRVVASLALPDGSGGFVAGGALEVWRAGGARCHVPDVDVPGVLTLDAAIEGQLTFLATYDGLIVMRGSDVELLDGDRGLPRSPVTAACGDGRGGCWAGTWGEGLLHVQLGPQGSSVTRYRFRGPSGTAEQSRVQIR